MLLIPSPNMLTIKLDLSLMIVLLVNGVISSDETMETDGTSSASPIMETFPELTAYTTAIARARCQARCNDKYGVKKQLVPHEFAQMYRPFVCRQEENNCQECSSQCRTDAQVTRDCKTYCTSDICLDSCLFLNTSLHDALPRSGLETTVETERQGHYKTITLTRPEPACIYTPVAQQIDPAGSTIVLKWTVLESNGEATLYPLTFVIEVTDKQGNESQIAWRLLGHTSFSVVPIRNLDSSSRYKFRVSAVSPDGIITSPMESKWIGFSPAPPLQTPQNVSIVSQYIRGNALRAELQWNMPNNAGCYFKLYWMTPKRGSFSSRELKEWMGYKYELSSLEFDSDYKLEIQTYDRHFQTASEKATVEFSTPACLQSTNYNYNLCAPDPPHSVSVNISRPYESVNKSVFTNVTFRWKPPKYVSWHNNINKYVVILRKTPDIRYTQLIPPDRRIFYIDGNTTEFTITDVHWDSEYVANIAAESPGGTGEKADIRIVTGNGYSELVAAESEAADTGSSSNKLHLVIVLPIVAGAVIGAFAALCYYRLRINKLHVEQPARKEEANPLYDTTLIPAEVEKEPLLCHDKYEVDYSRLKFIALLGEGAFGKVLKAEFTPLNQTGQQENTTKTVAVKMLKEHATPEERRFLLLEISAMKFLGVHLHLVSIIACITDKERPCLIMDYCPLGDLRNYLQQHRTQIHYVPQTPQNTIVSTRISRHGDVDAGTAGDSLNSSSNYRTNCTDVTSCDSPEPLSQNTLLSYARQVAIGMEYLSQHRFIHRDLASRNILVSSHKVVKISDFGLCRDVYETNVYQPTSGRRLPYKWMPIESIFDQIFTIKSDVWSYGILLWEIVTLGGCPYLGISNNDLFRLLKEGYRLGRPSNCSQDLYNIMLSCWHPRPEDRPSFTQLKKKMDKLLEATCPYIDLNVGVSQNYEKNDSKETETQRKVLDSTAEQISDNNLPMLNTDEGLGVNSDSLNNNNLHKRYYISDADRFPKIHETKIQVHHPNSLDLYSLDDNQPVPGLSEELLRETRSSTEHRNTTNKIKRNIYAMSCGNSSSADCSSGLSGCESGRSV